MWNADYEFSVLLNHFSRGNNCNIRRFAEPGRIPFEQMGTLGFCITLYSFPIPQLLCAVVYTLSELIERNVVGYSF